MLEPKQPNLFFKYGNIAIQMGAIIGLSVWGGQKLDIRYQNTTPVFTIVLSLAGISAALYVALKDFIKPKK
jgi:F0F1-type ATP synthase assembly protein I